MFDFSNLIGLTETQAKKTLKDNGFEKIKTIVNAEHKDVCDTLVEFQSVQLNLKNQTY